MSGIRWKRLAVGMAIAGPVILVLSAIAGRFGSTSVCDRCGAIRETTEWQVPFTRKTLFRHDSVRASAVSAVLTDRGVVPAHQHHWRFGQGSGNGIGCTIGPGDRIGFVAESEDVAALFVAVERFGDLELRDRLFRAVFDEYACVAVWALGRSMPAGGVADADAFRAWFARQAGWFDRALEYRLRR